MDKPLQDNELRTYPSGIARICAAVLVVAPDMDTVICREPAPRYGEDDPYDRMGYRAQAAFDAGREPPAERIKREDDESDVVDDYGRPTVFDLMAERGPGRRDARPHSSVQAWSRGPLFPAVIARVERYDHRPMERGESMEHLARPLAERLHSVSYELTIGAFREEYATREDAETVARWCCANGQIIPERYAALMEDNGWGIADAPHPMADA